jgi:hypothetical protein
MSSTTVVAAVGPTVSTLRGPTIDVFNFGGGRCWTCRQHPPGGPTIDVFNFGGAHYRTCRQHPLGGPPSTSSTPVMAAAGHAGSTPRGPAIDLFNFGGGRCQICRQHSLGGPHRRFQLWWWPLPNLPLAPPRARHRRLGNLVPAPRIFLAAPTRGTTVVNITTTSKTASQKSEGKSFSKIIFGSLRCQETGIHITTT